MCRAKIHRARLTKKDIHYEGSITVARELLEASGIRPNEVVQVININSGARFETYVIEGKQHSGIALNGGAARLGEVDDLLIILSCAYVDEKEIESFKPKVVTLDGNNNIIRTR
jgi:aspartate 1-decarboxylase